MLADAQTTTAPAADIAVADADRAVRAAVTGHVPIIGTVGDGGKVTLNEAGRKRMGRKLYNSTTAQWDRLVTRFHETDEASDRAADLEAESPPGPEDEALRERNKPIHAAWREARDALLGHPAPHWAGLALKAKVMLRVFGDGDDKAPRWERAAADFQKAAEALGDGDPTKADSIGVLSARGHAEQIAYFLANRPDGYAAWGMTPDHIADLASAVDRIQTESRDLADAAGLQGMSALAFDAVWIGRIPGDPCPVELLADDFSDVLRSHGELDERKDLAPAEEARLDALDKRLWSIPDDAFASIPTTKTGVAFQLLCAAGQIERVARGTTEAIKEDAEEVIIQALANAIRALGLPFDSRTAEFFMGNRLADLDGARQPGPAR